MTKELLYLNNTLIKTVTSDRLFYDKFKYSASFRLQEAWVYRYTFDHDEINKRLIRQQEWRERTAARWPAGSFNRYHDIITDQVREAVCMVAEYFQLMPNEYKLVVSGSRARVYTNDIKVLSDFEHMGYISERSYTQVEINRPKNTIRLKNPQHQLRSYFRETKISPDDRAAIKEFFNNQTDIRLGQGLRDWLDGKPQAYASSYTRDYFFIDHNEMSWLTMLALIRPGLIRRTVDIIAK